jgi:hypothetical protein
MAYLTEGVYYDTLELPTHCLGQGISGDQRLAHPLAGALGVDSSAPGLVAGKAEEEAWTRMIELPEALTMARQMSQELQGKRIESCIRGNAPHNTWAVQCIFARVARSSKLKENCP